jgi:phage terminase large subunit GpA-like protein
MDTLKRFTRVWCPTCGQTQPMIFDVSKASDQNDHDAANIVCEECKSTIATLHAPASVRRAGGRSKKAAKASEMAARQIDRLVDPSAPDEERQRRKRKLLRGPKEFRDIRGRR